MKVKKHHGTVHGSYNINAGAAKLSQYQVEVGFNTITPQCLIAAAKNFHVR